jgi:chlorophyll/bacteriochlorophyll a synthase
MTRDASTAIAESHAIDSRRVESRSAITAFLELLKPVTWFPPMWAFACGVVSTGLPTAGHWWLIVAGIVLAGPLVCGTSQAINDWFDRDVDAINEPGRPIPSGRVPGRRGLYFAIGWTVLSLAVAAMLGTWVLIAAVVGLVLAWAYSAPPLRLKQNGWWGNTAVAASYEGLPWFTAAAVMVGGLPDARIIAIAALYSLGAHGIMTLNDFKSVSGDARMGVRSLPVQLGVQRATWVACIFMIVPQLIVISLLLAWQRPLHAAAIGVLVLVQLFMMSRLIAAPAEKDYWYNATGVPLYVAGMMVSALALR